MTGPVALMSAAGGDLAQPGDQGAGGKPVKGRPKLEKASLSLYDPAPASGGSTGATSIPHRPVKTTRLITRGLVSARKSRQSAGSVWSVAMGRLVTASL